MSICFNQVTSVAWNSTGASLACAFGKLDTLGWCEVTAPVCVWNIFRPQHVAGEPDTVLPVQGFVMCIAFHPTKPSILAGGTYNGELQIWNTGSGELDPLLASSSIDDYLHREDSEVGERRKLQDLASKWRADDAEAWATVPTKALTASLYLGSVAFLHFSGGHWAAIIVLALTLVRAFIVFHDAAHASYFENPEQNKTLGQVLQFFINYSLDEWNTVHNSHHAHFGVPDDSSRTHLDAALVGSTRGAPLGAAVMLSRACTLHTFLSCTLELGVCATGAVMLFEVCALERCRLSSGRLPWRPAYSCHFHRVRLPGDVPLVLFRVCREMSPGGATVPLGDACANRSQLLSASDVQRERMVSASLSFSQLSAVRQCDPSFSATTWSFDGETHRNTETWTIFSALLKH
eukprot:Skav230218  [mRNA]  locus=scaffold1558:6181:16567:+ [translate_table: standard]